MDKLTVSIKVIFNTLSIFLKKRSLFPQILFLALTLVSASLGFSVSKDNGEFFVKVTKDQVESKVVFLTIDFEGHVLVEDILLTKAQHEFMFGNGTLDRNADPTRRWPNGVIPYKFSSYFTKDHKDRILSGIAYINENLKGCIEIR